MGVGFGGEVVDEELGEVGAGDFVGLSVGWDDVDLAGGFVVGEDGGADDGPVDVGMHDFCFHVVFVPDGAGEEERDEEVLVEEAGLVFGVGCAQDGDGEEAGGSDAVHDFQDDFGGGGFEVGGFEGGFAAESVDDGVAALHGVLQAGGVLDVAVDDFD